MLKLTSPLITLFLATAFALAQPPPQSAADLFRRGVEFLKTQKFEEALTAFQAAAKLEPRSSPTQGNIGASLMALNRPTEAIAAFREAAKLAPTDGTFQTALCRALVATKKYDEAVKACEEGVRLNPASASAHAALIEAMDLAGRPDADLMRLINAALTNFRDSEEVLVASAEYASFQRNRQLAVELWEQLARRRPNSAYYLGRFSEACVDVEREAEALTAARRALEIEPDNPYAHYAMGRIFLELGQHGDASKALNIARSRKDRLAYVQYYYGVSESRAGRAQSSIEAFRVAIQENRDDFYPHLALGQELIGSAQYEDAVIPLRRAVALDPKDLEAKVALGLALGESAQYAEGIKVLEEAERAKPGNEIVAMFLRVARSRQEWVPKIDEMKAWAKANPKHLNIRINLIETLSFARRIAEADPYLQEALALQPKDIREYVRIAVAYTTAGDTERALSILRKSFELGEDPATYLNLAGILSRKGRADEASAAYAKVIELKPDAAQTMKLYADHLRDNGKRREALEMYRRSLSMIPTFGPTLASAAILSAKLDDPDAAKTYLATLKTVDPELAAKVEGVLVLLRYLK